MNSTLGSGVPLAMFKLVGSSSHTNGYLFVTPVSSYAVKILPMLQEKKDKVSFARFNSILKQASPSIDTCVAHLKILKKKSLCRIEDSHKLRTQRSEQLLELVL